MKPVRALAWFAIAAQFAFIAAWIVGGALEPGYSHVEQYISELGADDAAHPLLMNAGILVLGLGVAALGPALLATLPRRRAARVAAALFFGAGIAIAIGGIFNLDCSTAVSAACEARWDRHAHDFSTQTAIHKWTGLVGEVLFLLTPFPLARALWGRPAAAPALASGLIGVGIFLAADVGSRGGGGDDYGGLIQRLGLASLHLWVLIVAIGVLWATRRAPEPPPATPLRPREFFANTWTGEGELVPWPYLFWRRFPQRLRIRRTATFLSDEAWYFDDTTWSADGALLDERRVFCQLVAPDRVRITSDQLLDGTEILLEEDGYRIMPYRVAVPVGPVHFGVRVRDSATMRDGTLVNRLGVSWFGLPVARVELRARSDSNGA